MQRGTCRLLGIIHPGSTGTWRFGPGDAESRVRRRRHSVQPGTFLVHEQCLVHQVRQGRLARHVLRRHRARLLRVAGVRRMRQRVHGHLHQRLLRQLHVHLEHLCQVPLSMIAAPEALPLGAAVPRLALTGTVIRRVARRGWQASRRAPSRASTSRLGSGGAGAWGHRSSWRGRPSWSRRSLG